MKFLFLWLAATAFALAVPRRDLIQRAGEPHGLFGEHAARFLVEHVPESDRESLSVGSLLENLDLALRARSFSPWGKKVPEKIFFNEELPYAVLGKPSDPWRVNFFAKTLPMIARADSASEVAQNTNRDFVERINTHDHLSRTRTDPPDPAEAICASSWQQGREASPTPWSQQKAGVGAVNVIHRYVSKLGDKPVSIGVRFFDGTERLAVPGALTTAAGHVLAEFETKTETADLNDTAQVPIEPEQSYRLRFSLNGSWRETIEFRPSELGLTTIDVRPGHLKPIPELHGEGAKILRENVPRAIRFAYEEVFAESREARARELEEKAITLGEHSLRWQEIVFGEEPAEGHSLWISLHGGGQTPAEVNDQQWQNQAALYQPKEGIYLAPRAPTDTWNLWHQDHIDALLSRLIESMLALRKVDPNKIFLMGYSAGGDGVWQLAPRMADRFAAAAMMAGHPNDASLLSLRNLPFAIFMGGEDNAYERKTIAAQKCAELMALNRDDPKGYPHLCRIYPGLPHWMDGKDAEALPWMAKFARDPWPRKIVWVQDDVLHERFYWLRVPAAHAMAGQQITASVQGQTIQLIGDVPEALEILLSDEFIDLDRAISVKVNHQTAREYQAARSGQVMREALTQRLDPSAVPTAKISLK